MNILSVLIVECNYIINFVFKNQNSQNRQDRQLLKKFFQIWYIISNFEFMFFGEKVLNLFPILPILPMNLIM